ncbi:MAG: acyltransferase [Candidatus Marinimicrobia bacterium]|nr:acyltransferase [Candidatus Neomarinimicrobiota bacterium]MCF7828783.1 acyltransferase [Candidatus Neomarinimicrobiota bacterium]MCF7880700.1 acyltransferase [Candidatus Neomarinimicrobiota bacterium]
MKSLFEKLFRRIKKDKSFTLHEQWTLLPVVTMLLSMAMSLVRGKCVGINFKKQEGFIFVKKGVRLMNTHHIEAGKNLILEEGCEINGLAKKGIKFGTNVTVGAYALIRPSNFYGGEPGEGLKVGDNSNIGPYSYIGCSGYIEIGCNVMFGPRISVYSENHNFQRTDITIKEQGIERQFVKIEDDCWIGSNSVILPGVTIGKGVVVAAGSIVTKDIAPYSVVAGNPARILKNRN